MRGLLNLGLTQINLLVRLRQAGAAGLLALTMGLAGSQAALCQDIPLPEDKGKPPVQDDAGEKPPVPSAPSTTPAPTPPPSEPSSPPMPAPAPAPAPVVPSTPPSFTNPQLYEQTLHSTAYVECPDVGSGSGWVIDKEKRLIITNYHVVENKDTVFVYFPVYKDGRAIPDPQYYVDNEKPIKGTVFDTDKSKDLALIQLASIPDDVVALKLAEHSPNPGDPVLSVGGNPQGSRALWVLTSGTVRQVYHRTYRLSDSQIVDSQVVETQSPVNHGDSGGPVVNDRGELVAVVSAGFEGQLMTVFIDVSEVKKYAADVVPLLEPQSPMDYNTRGLRYRKQGRLGRAITDFTEAIKQDPKLAVAYANRGWSFTYQGDYDTAVGDFKEAIDLDPKCADAYHGRGYTYNERGQYDLAIEDCTQAIRYNPDDASAYNNRAWAYSNKGEYGRAIDDYNRAIQKDPNDAVYFNNRGDAFYYGNDYDSAIRDYTKAVEINPYYATAWYNRGYVMLNKKNNPDQAVADFTSALKVNTRYAAAYEERGEAHWARKDYSAALNDYNMALQINANYAEAYFDRGYLHHYHLNNADQALKDYNEAIRLNPNAPSYFNFRGNLYSDHNDLDHAIADYTAAIQLNPKNATYYSNRGNIYSRKGDQTRAQQDYAKAIEIDPTSVKNQIQKQDRRFLRVANNSGQAIELRVIFHTKSVNGDWIWYPNSPNSGQYYNLRVEAGASTYLFLKDVKISADRAIIWAVGLDSGGSWNRDEIVLCPPEGYMSALREDFTYTFNP